MRAASVAAKRWGVSTLGLRELCTATGEASIQPAAGQDSMQSSARIVVEVVVRLQAPGESGPRANPPNRARLSGHGWQSPVLRLSCGTDAQRPSWRPLSVADEIAAAEEADLTSEGDVESWSAVPPAAAPPSLASLQTAGRRRRHRVGSAGGHDRGALRSDRVSECGDGDESAAVEMQQVRDPLDSTLFCCSHDLQRGKETTRTAAGLAANCKMRHDALRLLQYACYLLRESWSPHFGMQLGLHHPAALTLCKRGKLTTLGVGAQPHRYVGLDVEHAHFRDGSVRAAEVCIVGAGGDVIFHSFCNPGAADARSGAADGHLNVTLQERLQSRKCSSQLHGGT